MSSDLLLKPAQRAAILYNHYLHGIERPEELVWCWRTHRWRWCQVIDLGKREAFEPWRNKRETMGRDMTGGPSGAAYRKQARRGARRRAIEALLAEHKCLTTQQIANHIGLSIDATYKAISRHPNVFERLSNGRGIMQVWRLRDVNRQLGDRRESEKCSTRETLRTEG